MHPLSVNPVGRTHKMDTPHEQNNPIRKYNQLAIGSFVLVLVTIIFPIISIFFLIAENGGGYVQSIFCGIPVTFVNIITGIVSLMQIRMENQQGAWMAILGIVFGILYFGILVYLAAILIMPFLIGGAQ
jgi:hypothetical protein